MIGQIRKVRIGEGQWISGTVEAVFDNTLSLFVEQGVPSQLPREGQLRVDRDASLIAIRRQKAAVEATRNARTVRSDLGALIIHPEKALPPEHAGGLVFAQELDEKKQEAVSNALGSPDFMTVVGPPGTGKTTFIAELVWQFKQRHPDARVLITAQTHVAVDNAISRLRKLGPDIRIIRVGTKERLADDVVELGLDSQLAKWRVEANSLAQQFLNQRAAADGIDRKFAEVLSSIEQVRLSEAALANVNSQLEAPRKTEFELMDELTDPGRQPERKADEGAVPVTTAEPAEAVEISLSDALTSLQDEIDALTADAKRLDRAIARIRRAIARTMEVDAGIPTVDLLQIFHDRYHPDPTALARLGELETLQQEWLQRFGQGAEFVGALISMADVVAGTCVGIASVRQVEDLDFDLVIIDEASKATPTEALVPMVMGKKWVLVGDPNQLPPFLDEALRDPAILLGTTVNLEDLQITLFDRLLAGLPETSQVSLTVQHRMIKAIGDLVSHCFYRDTLESPIELGKLTSVLKYLPVPVVWFSTSNLSGRSEASDGKSSYINQTEIARIVNLLTSLDRVAQLSQETLSVAVISAYDAQKHLLYRELQPQSRRWSNLRLDINTVDAFQGQERDIVVYSVTRSNDAGELGFLRSDRRLNVALSRGREALIIVGDSRFCELARSPDNPFRCVLEYLRGHPDTCRLEYVDQ